MQELFRLNLVVENFTDSSGEFSKEKAINVTTNLLAVIKDQLIVPLSELPNQVSFYGANIDAQEWIGSRARQIAIEYERLIKELKEDKHTQESFDAVGKFISSAFSQLLYETLVTYNGETIGLGKFVTLNPDGTPFSDIDEQPDGE